MENDLLDQITRLDDFVTTVLRPVVRSHDSVQKSATEATRLIAQAILVEVFLWLELGGRFNIYPPDAVSDIFSDYAHRLPGKDSEYSNRWGFIYDYFSLERLYASIAHGRVTPEVDLGHSRVFSFGLSFQMLVRQASSILLNPLSREFAAVVNFYSNDLFEALLVSDIRGNDVVSAFADPSSKKIPLKARTVAGYFLTLQYMDAVISMIGNQQRPSAVDPGIWAMFRIETSRVPNWRLSFGGSNTRVPIRFKQFTDNVEAALHMDARSLEIELPEGGLQVLVNTLLLAWRNLSLPAERWTGL